MLECIYHKRYGGKWWFRFCCHVWANLNLKFIGGVRFEKNECLECGRKENMMMIEW